MGLFGRRKFPVPPESFAYQQRQELQGSGTPTFRTAPDSQFNELLPLDIAWQQAPDPIRQSVFWDAGNKVHPGAQMAIQSNLAIGAKESVMQNEFRIGKLLGYLHAPMYAGGQHPSVIRANIQEAVPTTYGSLYQVQGVRPSGAEVTTPTGFQVPFSIVTPQGAADGYPY